MNTLNATFNSINNITKSDSMDIEKNFCIRTFNKGDIVCRKNEVCNQLGFIIKGYLRIFIDKEEKEVTIHLAGPNQFITSFSSFIHRTPSIEYIQAVTKTEIAFINYEKLHQLFSEDQKFEKLGRQIIEKHLIDKERRVISLLSQSAEERYFRLMESNPDIIQNVPLQYIASYLGIKPETLSRIRGRRYMPMAS